MWRRGREGSKHAANYCRDENGCHVKIAYARQAANMKAVRAVTKYLHFHEFVCHTTFDLLIYLYCFLSYETKKK